MHKLIIALLFCSIMLPLTIASAAMNEQADPCAELSGHWKGVWNNLSGTCIYDIELDAANYKNNIQLAVNFKRTKGPCIPEASLEIITGTCTDGKLDLVLNDARYKLTGRVFGGMLTMEMPGWTAYARKQ